MGDAGRGGRKQEGRSGSPFPCREGGRGVRSGELEEAPPPEELLREALIKELCLVRQHNERLLSEVNLELLTIGDAPSKLAVVCDSSQTLINSRHPLVAAALARFEDDPMWVTFLASTVYTAINCWLEEVTDDDEAHFHDQLTRLVISGLTGAKRPEA